MVDDDEETGGYAIGRRIYEKQEIDVSRQIYQQVFCEFNITFMILSSIF